VGEWDGKESCGKGEAGEDAAHADSAPARVELIRRKNSSQGGNLPVRTVTPMIHVPDVRTTAAWYESIGFTIRAVNEDDGEMTWAAVRYGDGEFMLNVGGQVSHAARREVDLYVSTDDVNGTYERLKGHVQVVEELHDTFYGMREFIIRDCNGFWITFGTPVE